MFQNATKTLGFEKLSRVLSGSHLSAASEQTSGWASIHLLHLDSSNSWHFAFVHLMLHGVYSNPNGLTSIFLSFDLILISTAITWDTEWDCPNKLYSDHGCQHKIVSMLVEE